LLRVHNEAQMAAILGHELGHYLRRHSLQRFRDVRAKADFAAFLSMGLSLAGAGAATPALQTILVASIFAFSREHEREADNMGLELMADAGYDPSEASKVWQQLIEERKARETQTPRDIVFASHPAPEERLETLRSQALARKSRDLLAAYATFEGRYGERLREPRRWMLRDEVRLRQYGPSLAMFDQLLAVDAEDADVLFAKGEVFRVRNEGDDLDRALNCYARSIATGRAPPEAYRSTGFVHQRRRDHPAAKSFFERYLDLRPDADDGEAIRSYIGEGARGA
jgi:tetratricopeptide (TPR) repeat protein